MNKVTVAPKPRPKIMIASPICQALPILQYFLQSLRRLDVSGFDILYDFIDDNDERASSALLEHFAADHPHATILRAEPQVLYMRNETTHYWNEELVWKVAQFKDSFIERALSLGVDALLLIDSDLLLHPQTLAHLYQSETEIVSEIFWTRWQPDSIPQPQVWLRDEYAQWAQQRGEQLNEEEKAVRILSFFNMLKAPGLYKVGGLGACTLIRRSALERGVCFKPIYNLSFWGEDRHFCIRAAALGLEMYVDTHYPAYHIYRLGDLDEAEKYMNETAESLAITLSTVVHPGHTGYLKELLNASRPWIAQAVILDNGTGEDIETLAAEALQDVPLRFIRLSQPLPEEMPAVQQRLWSETLAAEPQWILNLNGDELPENGFFEQLASFMSSPGTDALSFRINSSEDNPISYHRLLIKYRHNTAYHWRPGIGTNPPRFPEGDNERSAIPCHLRIKCMNPLTWEEE